MGVRLCWGHISIGLTLTAPAGSLLQGEQRVLQVWPALRGHGSAERTGFSRFSLLRLEVREDVFFVAHPLHDAPPLQRYMRVAGQLDQRRAAACWRLHHQGAYSSFWSIILLLNISMKIMYLESRG